MNAVNEIPPVALTQSVAGQNGGVQRHAGWIAVYSGGYPLKIHRQICGQVFSLVAEGEATVFESAAAAGAAAQAAGCKYFTVKLKAEI